MIVLLVLAVATLVPTKLVTGASFSSLAGRLTRRRRRGAHPSSSSYSSYSSLYSTKAVESPSKAVAACPTISPATGLPNQFYTWKEGQHIRYQESGNPNDEPILLIHGLFVNADHWRHTLTQLNQPANPAHPRNDDQQQQRSSSSSSSSSNYRIYAIDLFGCGYSDKPLSTSNVAQRCNGENRRFYSKTNSNHPPDPSVSILRNVKLGCPQGRSTQRVRDIELTHPIHSPYNFYTWSDLIVDFCRDVVLAQSSQHRTVALVCNSIGTISAFQAVLDAPTLFRGVFVVSPNFRELHSAEVPLPAVTMPVLRTMQALLRTQGKPVYDALTNPTTIKEILKVPYAVQSAVDDTLVQVLLDPLLTPGSSEVVFDTLSYSAGPLPEQQLQAFPSNIPVWVCYGKDDPWTPGLRVEALTRWNSSVERVQGWDHVGHCPHDERPDLVHPMLRDFLRRVCDDRKGK